MPTGRGKLVCPGPETGEYTVIQESPPESHAASPQLNQGPRYRPARLRPCIRPLYVMVMNHNSLRVHSPILKRALVSITTITNS